MHTRHRIAYLLPFLTGLLAPVLPASAADGPGAAPGTVVVNGGIAGRAGNRTAIVIATDPLFSPNSASSCGFMARYNPKYDPVTVAYMRDFGMLASSSYDRPLASTAAPFGDASVPYEELGLDVRHGGSRRGGFGGCSGFDFGGAGFRFAAGRAHILAHDKSLAQAFQAFAAKDYVLARERFTEAWNKIGYGGIPAL